MASRIVAVAAERIGEEVGTALLQLALDRRRDAGDRTARTSVGLDARPVARSSTAATSSPASTTEPVATSSSLASEREAGTATVYHPRSPAPRFVVDVPDRPPFAPVDLFEYQGKQLFAQYGIPVSDGAPVTTVPEAVEVADRIGYPVVVKAQVQVGGRGKAGRHQARRQRRGGPHPRRGHPRHGHQGPRGEGRLDRAGQRHRRGVLRVVHPRPRGQAAPRDALGAGRRRDRAGGGGESRRPGQDPHRSGRRAHRGAVAASGWRPPSSTRRPPRARSTSC